jgi:hypothetical protein
MHCKHTNNVNLYPQTLFIVFFYAWSIRFSKKKKSLSESKFRLGSPIRLSSYINGQQVIIWYILSGRIKELGTSKGGQLFGRNLLYISYFYVYIYIYIYIYISEIWKRLAWTQYLRTLGLWAICHFFLRSLKRQPPTNCWTIVKNMHLSLSVNLASGNIIRQRRLC